MKFLSVSILLSACVVAGVIYLINQEKQIPPAAQVDDYIFKITDSGNLVRFNKKTLKMTLCGLSDREYRCLHFENK